LSSRRTLDAADFRRMILEALPELAARVRDAAPGGAHRDASILYGFARDAVLAGDLARTERVFRLAGQLLAVSDRFDFYTENALWTSFVREIPRHSPEGLALFRRMSPEVRRSLYCPFVIPHTWFEREVLDVPCPSGRRYSVLEVARERARYVKQASGPCHFADVTLRVAPSDADEAVVFVNGVPADRNLPLEILEASRDEVRETLGRRARAGQCLRAVTITLLESVFHPVDTKTPDVRRVTRKALGRALEKGHVVRT
jgi:hypothetical protein